MGVLVGEVEDVPIPLMTSTGQSLWFQSLFLDWIATRLRIHQAYHLYPDVLKMVTSETYATFRKVIHRQKLFRNGTQNWISGRAHDMSRIWTSGNHHYCKSLRFVIALSGRLDIAGVMSLMIQIVSIPAPSPMLNVSPATYIRYYGVLRTFDWQASCFNYTKAAV